MVSDATHRALRILLIEDDDDHAYLISRGFAASSHCRIVTRLTDGEAAAAHLDRVASGSTDDRPDLILLDLKIPLMDGQDVLARIKRDPRIADIPVLVLSTSDAELDRRRAYANHVNSYIVKPTDGRGFDELGASICRYWCGLNVPARG